MIDVEKAWKMLRKFANKLSKNGLEYLRGQSRNASVLKGLSHEIFGPVYRPVWMHLGLKKNRFCFFKF
jgi:hypothetical protein